MNRVLFPGSFDPPTLGHIDLIRRAASIYDEVIVAVLVNIHKAGRYPMDRRVRMLEACCAGMRNVRAIGYDGLTVDLARSLDIRVILRGVRSAADFEYERGMAAANGMLYPGLETIMMLCSPGLEGISSSTVRELLDWGRPVNGFVPDEVIPYLDLSGNNIV